MVIKNLLKVSNIFGPQFINRSIKNDVKSPLNLNSDLERDVRYFVGNYAILKPFHVEYPVLLTENGGRRVEDRELRYSVINL